MLILQFASLIHGYFSKIDEDKQHYNSFMCKSAALPNINAHCMLMNFHIYRMKCILRLGPKFYVGMRASIGLGKQTERTSIRVSWEIFLVSANQCLDLFQL